MAKNRIIKKGDGSSHVKLLRRYGTPFTQRDTNSTTRIETEDEIRIYTENALPMKDLSFIGRVRANCRSLDPDLFPEQSFTAKNVRYNRFNRIAQKRYDNLTEVDVNSAYWEIANKFGYLTPELYEEGLEVEKTTRMIALGALATKYQYWRYEGGPKPPKLLTVEEDDDDRRVRSYFFHVAGHLGKIMESVANVYDGVLWYWVDAFFVEREHAKLIPEALAMHGLECKEKRIDRVEVEEVFRNGVNQGLALCCYMEGEFGTFKPFFIQNKKTKALRKQRALMLALDAPDAP